MRNLTLVHRLLAAGLALLCSLGMPMPASAQGAAGDTSGYVLGASDEIQVTIFGPTTDDVKTRIREDGTIVLPYSSSALTCRWTTALAAFSITIA